MLMMFASCRGGAPVAGDTTAPTISSRTIDSAGTSLTLAFSEAVTVSDGSGFTVSLSGGAATVSYSSGSGTSSLVYTLSRTVNSGETGTLSYSTVSNGIEDAAGNDLASFSGASITNNSSQSSSAWLETDFAGFASLNAMMEAGGGPFYERDVLGDATWTLANTTDYLGNTKQCLRFDLYRNEDLALLGFVLPDTTYGTAGSGQDTIYYRFREKRSSNYRFLADKSSRVVSKYGGAGGSAYIDILTAFGGGGVSGNSSTVTQAFGQANVNDSNYIDTSYSWAVNTWILVEVEIVLGTVNGGDSEYRYWINGTLVGELTGFSILEGVVQGGTDFHRFQEFRLGGWESGGTSNNLLNGGTAESRWYDDLYIGPSRPA